MNISPIYEEAVSRIWLWNCSILNLLKYWNMRKIWFSLLSVYLTVERLHAGKLLELPAQKYAYCKYVNDTCNLHMSEYLCTSLPRERAEKEGNHKGYPQCIYFHLSLGLGPGERDGCCLIYVRCQAAQEPWSMIVQQANYAGLDLHVCTVLT